LRSSKQSLRQFEDWRKEKITDEYGKIVPQIVEPSCETSSTIKREGPAVIEGMRSAAQTITAKPWTDRPVMIRKLRANPVIDNNLSDYRLEELHQQVLDWIEDPSKNKIAFSGLYAKAVSESAEKAGYNLKPNTVKTYLKPSKPSRQKKQSHRGRPRKNLA
jgi:hypothetical protein